MKDEDVDKNPDILKQYKRIIVLHNEYVTKKEFDAITSHPDVVFLYPNALYAQVEANYTSNTITLVHGDMVILILRSKMDLIGNMTIQNTNMMWAVIIGTFTGLIIISC